MLTRIVPIALLLAPAVALAQPAVQPPQPQQMTPEQMQAVLQTLSQTEAQEHQSLILADAQRKLDAAEIAQLKAQIAAAAKKAEPAKTEAKKP